MNIATSPSFATRSSSSYHAIYYMLHSTVIPPFTNHSSHHSLQIHFQFSHTCEINLPNKSIPITSIVLASLIIYQTKIYKTIVKSNNYFNLFTFDNDMLLPTIALIFYNNKYMPLMSIILTKKKRLF